MRLTGLAIGRRMRWPRSIARAALMARSLMARSILLSLSFILCSAAVRAEQIAVTDVLGRSVRVTVPVERVLLGEGRQIHIVAALDREAPFRRVIGWGDDLEKADPDTYRAYLARYPEIAALPKFGAASQGGFDIEKAVSLKPDVVFLNVEAQRAGEEVQLIEKLASVGVPVVYIDFRHAPFRNTEPSLRLMGQLFGRSEVAEALIAFRASEIARVTERLANTPELRRPLVMLDRIPGYSDDCCMTFGPENFGKMVEIAGGTNLGSELLSGTFGTINPETIVVRNPEVVIATGGNWGALAPGEAGSAWGREPISTRPSANSPHLPGVPPSPRRRLSRMVASMPSGINSTTTPTSSWRSSGSQPGCTPRSSPISMRRRPCANSMSASCRYLIGRATGSGSMSGETATSLHRDMRRLGNAAAWAVEDSAKPAAAMKAT